MAVPLTEKDREMLRTLAKEVERRAMTVPLIFFLEMHKPLAFVASSFLVTLGPILRLIFDLPQYNRITELLEDRGNVETFILLLEEASRKPEASPKEREANS
jgi:hypothetical protein